MIIVVLVEWWRRKTDWQGFKCGRERKWRQSIGNSFEEFFLKGKQKYGVVAWHRKWGQKKFLFLIR